MERIIKLKENESICFYLDFGNRTILLGSIANVGLNTKELDVLLEIKDGAEKTYYVSAGNDIIHTQYYCNHYKIKNFHTGEILEEKVL